MMKGTTSMFYKMLTVLAVVIVGTALAEEFEITHSTIDGGGMMNSSGGDFELSGTIGQPDAGTSSGSGFTLTGGFWFETPVGDCNSTGGVNLLDYDDFESCLSGPEGGLPADECNCFDIDRDDDVDLSDMAQFQQFFTAG